MNLVLLGNENGQKIFGRKQQNEKAKCDKLGKTEQAGYFFAERTGVKNFMVDRHVENGISGNSGDRSVIRRDDGYFTLLCRS